VDAGLEIPCWRVSSSGARPHRISERPYFSSGTSAVPISFFGVHFLRLERQTVLCFLLLRIVPPSPPSPFYLTASGYWMGMKETFTISNVLFSPSFVFLVWVSPQILFMDSTFGGAFHSLFFSHDWHPFFFWLISFGVFSPVPCSSPMRVCNRWFLARAPPDDPRSPTLPFPAGPFTLRASCLFLGTRIPHGLSPQRFFSPASKAVRALSEISRDRVPRGHVPFPLCSLRGRVISAICTCPPPRLPGNLRLL